MNSRAFIVLTLLLAAIFPLALVASVDDTKHAVGNQVEGSTLSCKYGRCGHAGEIPSVEAGEAKYELDQGVGGGLDEDESKYGQGVHKGGYGSASERTLQRGGGDSSRGGGGGDTERGGGRGDSSRGGRRGDRQRRGRRGRRGGRGGRGGRM